MKFSTATRNQNDIFRVKVYYRENQNNIFRVKGYYRKSFVLIIMNPIKYCMCFTVIKLKPVDYSVQAGTTGEKYINTADSYILLQSNNAIFIYKVQMKFLFYQGNNMTFKLYIYMCNVNIILKIEWLDCLNDI